MIFSLLKTPTQCVMVKVLGLQSQTVVSNVRCFTHTFNPAAQKNYTISGVWRWAPKINVTNSVSSQSETWSPSVPGIYTGQESVFDEHYAVKMKMTFDLMDIRCYHFILSDMF